jgi:anthranilate phosphoribosyltransferase
MISFKQVIKAVGTGPKGNRKLEDEEVKFIINAMLKREISDARIGAFLQAWRLNGEDHDELRVGYKTLTSYIHNHPINRDSILLGYAMDGKIRNPYLLVLANKYLDIKCSLNIDELIPAKGGVTAKDLFENTLLKNFIINDRREYLKELSNLTKIRNDLTLRTAFNTLEKLLNPSKSKYAIVGFTHGAYKEFYASLRSYASLKRLVVVKGGDEGSPDISKPCRIYVIDETQEFEFEVKPNDFEAKSIATKKDKTKDEIIDLIRNNKVDENLIKLNAALLLITCKKFDNIQEAYNSIKG